MSVIYDALKKIERSNGIASTVKINKTDKPKPKVYLVYVLLICLGFFIASRFFGITTSPQVLSKEKAEPEVKTPPSEANAPIPESKDINTEPKKEPPHTFVLNGIFFSQGEGYCLINNQIAKEGNLVDGALVLRITLEEVELESEGSIVRLYTNR